MEDIPQETIMKGLVEYTLFILLCVSGSFVTQTVRPDAKKIMYARGSFVVQS